MDGEVISRAAGAVPVRSLPVLTQGWLRPSQGEERTGAPRARASRMLSASRLIVLLAVAALGATLVAGAIGYGMAGRNDARVWAEQRAALRNAVAEFRALFGRSGAVDPRFVHIVEQSARLERP